VGEVGKEVLPREFFEKKSMIVEPLEHKNIIYAVE
jgi:hypothetical protein